MEREAARRLIAEAARELRRNASEDGSHRSSVLTLVNAILDTALAEDATDVHLEPMGGFMRIRMRVDGLLRERPVQFPRELAPVIIARLKVMAGIDTAKRNRPQDGQIRYVSGGRTIHMRVAVVPVVDGERMVVRIMDASERFLGCAELGFTPRNQELFEQLIHRPTGLLLLCGPMNSGKTTTLASLIEEINRTRRVHIVTLEDPIEYIFPSACAFLSQREAGRDFVSFSDAVRSALREDPDILLVGEMRDRATVEAVLMAAATGVLVLGTLHTRSAAETPMRVESMFSQDVRDAVRAQFADAVTVIAAQRLLPRVGGGRAAVFETLAATPAVRNILRQGSYSQLVSVMMSGAAQGMQTAEMAENALRAKGMIA